MALNLSESRRAASRRSASAASAAAIPPGLAPLPNAATATGASLQHHLQQQRRSSRNISPRPDRALSARLPSAMARANSPLQPSFDLAREGSYRHYFTPATLARAQKAKEHLELMAQYRRLLELVPPLTPASRRPSTATNPTTSLSATSSHASASPPPPAIRPLGRPYNPLQYIRNRKVRARERKAIDGVTLGFSDLKKVTDWVDDVARWAATGQSALPDTPVLPPFADADAYRAQLESPSSNAPKPKRPRLDWVIDPADMIADVYWLEQDNHLQLIEDRDWRRVFPQTTDRSSPPACTKQTDKTRPGTSHDISMPQPRTAAAEPPSGGTAASLLPNADSDHSHASTRERARQKLHELKGFPHHHRRTSLRHQPPKPRNDLLLEDGRNERSREGHRDHNQLQISSSNSDRNDILQKQMLEMIAREGVNETIPAANLHQPYSTVPLTPEQIPTTPPSQPSSQSQSRKQSVVDVSEPGDTMPAAPKHYHPTQYRRIRGRSSLEIPAPAYLGPMDLDTSAPHSPDNQHPRGGSPFVPPVGRDLSPSPSRPGSPHRNPFHKVRNIFRERSREREREPERDRDRDTEPQSDVKEVDMELPDHSKSGPPGLAPSLLPHAGTSSPAAIQAADRAALLNAQPPARVPAEAPWTSARVRPENTTPKVVSRGARLDTLIRDGVSKLGDFVWRKDDDPGLTINNNINIHHDNHADNDLALSRSKPDTTTEQENDDNPRVKHFLDVMPTFQHRSHESRELQTSGPPSRSSRFELLKPPRIDVQDLSSPSPSPSKARGESGTSAEQTEASTTTSDRLHEANRRLSSFAAAQSASLSSNGRHPSLASTFDGRRHWSISDRNVPFRPGLVSKREVARLRALVLSSGIKAMEISRRANQPVCVFVARTSDDDDADRGGPRGGGRVCWPSVAQLSVDPSDLRARAVPPIELYRVAGQCLAGAIQSADRAWQQAADDLAAKTTPALHQRVEDLRRRVAVDLSAMTRAAADDVDEANRDMAFGQRLKVKHVVDMMEKMLRRRRRRFRWVRRGLWLGVEWVLVGFMWYVWFVVVILRMFWGVGRAVVGGVKWLLWL